MWSVRGNVVARTQRISNPGVRLRPWILLLSMLALLDYDDFGNSEKKDFLDDFEDILERLEDAADDLC